MENQSIVIEREFDAPRMLIWQAITDTAEMKKWYFDIPGFKPEPGHAFEFTVTGKDGIKQFTHLCKVVEVVKGQKISYTWRYKGFPGDSLVTFELFDDGEKTKLRLTHEGIASFDEKNNPDLARSEFIEGWTQIITSLHDYFEKK